MPGSGSHHSMSGGHHSLPGSGHSSIPGGSMAPPPVQIKQEPGTIKIKQEKQEVLDDRQLNIMSSMDVPDFFMDAPPAAAGVSPPTTTHARDPPPPLHTSFMQSSPMLGHNYPPQSQSHHPGKFFFRREGDNWLIIKLVAKVFNTLRFLIRWLTTFRTFIEF